jgi:hypothetical protein
VVLRRVLELIHGQRDKHQKIVVLHVGWLLKGKRIRAAHEVSHVRTKGSVMTRFCRGSHLRVALGVELGERALLLDL